MHSAALQLERANQVKNNPLLRSLGRSYSAKRQWLWTHALDSHGYGSTEQGSTPKLIFEGGDEPDDWSQLEFRRAWLKHRIDMEGDPRTPVKLPPDASGPPLHGNAFKKLPVKVLQLERFKQFVNTNSVPTGRLRSGKTHHLIPSIRRIRPPQKLRPGANDYQRSRQAEMERESLTFQFNQSLLDIAPGMSTLGHDSICRLLKQYFPKHAISPIQSDYCDACAELKQQIDSARRSRQHLIDNGSSSVSKISDKDSLIESYEAALRIHRNLATQEQKEYKERIAKTQEFFRERIIEREHTARAQVCFSLSFEPLAEVVLACDFQMGKLLPRW
eukprot:IDg188t1